MDVTEPTQNPAVDQAECLKQLFASEPEVEVRFDREGERASAEVRVLVRGHHTLKSKVKADTANAASKKAVKRAEWKYQLFWTKDSLRYSDCC